MCIEKVNGLRAHVFHESLVWKGEIWPGAHYPDSTYSPAVVCLHHYRFYKDSLQSLGLTQRKLSGIGSGRMSDSRSPFGNCNQQSRVITYASRIELLLGEKRKRVWNVYRSRYTWLVSARTDYIAEQKARNCFAVAFSIDLYWVRV